MPTPVVHNGEIVYTFNGAQLYFNLLNLIIRMDTNVNHDNAAFLKVLYLYTYTYIPTHIHLYL
jgi:hypothetical protein